MNNNAQQGGLGFAIVVAIMIFIIGMTVVNLIKPEVTTARSEMSCSDSTISDGSKMTCLAIDIVIPYFIVIVLSLSGGYITSRFLIG